jgi:hypothetical protein
LTSTKFGGKISIVAAKAIMKKATIFILKIFFAEVDKNESI